MSESGSAKSFNKKLHSVEVRTWESQELLVAVVILLLLLHTGHCVIPNTSYMESKSHSLHYEIHYEEVCGKYIRSAGLWAENIVLQEILPLPLSSWVPLSFPQYKEFFLIWIEGPRLDIVCMHVCMLHRPWSPWRKMYELYRDLTPTRHPESEMTTLWPHLHLVLRWDMYLDTLSR